MAEKHHDGCTERTAFVRAFAAEIFWATHVWHHRPHDMHRRRRMILQQ